MIFSKSELTVGDRVKVLHTAKKTLRGRYGFVIEIAFGLEYATVQFNDFTEQIKVVDLRVIADLLGDTPTLS